MLTEFSASTAHIVIIGTQVAKGAQLRGYNASVTSWRVSNMFWTGSCDLGQCFHRFHQSVIFCMLLTCNTGLFRPCFHQFLCLRAFSSAFVDAASNKATGLRYLLWNMVLVNFSPSLHSISIRCLYSSQLPQRIQWSCALPVQAWAIVPPSLGA